MPFNGLQQGIIDPTNPSKHAGMPMPTTAEQMLRQVSDPNSKPIADSGWSPDQMKDFLAKNKKSKPFQGPSPSGQTLEEEQRGRKELTGDIWGKIERRQAAWKP